MKKKDSFYSPFLENIKKNKYHSIIIAAFLATVVVVLIVALTKTTTSKQEFVYAKVKLSQGLWWTQTQRPSIWFIDAIKEGDKELDFLGRPIVQILKVRYYPAIQVTPKYETEYNIYLTVKLATSFNKSTKKYVFKRTAIGVGSPINLNLSSVQITGTIIELNEEPFEDELVNKTITIYKEAGYARDFPYFYENIQIGDTYFDGEEVVLEVLDKDLLRDDVLTSDLYGRVFERSTSLKQNVIVTANIKLKEEKGQLVFGEEQVIKAGSPIYLTTSNAVFEDFFVSNIE